MGRALTVWRAVAVLAAAFGVATTVASSRVTAGVDPGYVVYRPLMWFNTTMGFAYLAAALLAWHGAGRGVSWRHSQSSPSTCWRSSRSTGCT